MRRALGPLVVVLFALFATAASAGVVPNHGGQSHSGAKVKPVNHDQDNEKTEQAPEKDDSSKEEKR